MMDATGRSGAGNPVVEALLAGALLSGIWVAVFGLHAIVKLAKTRAKGIIVFMCHEDRATPDTLQGETLYTGHGRSPRDVAQGFNS
jgi:hypothetical protein